MSADQARKIIVAVAPVSHHLDSAHPGPTSPEEVAAEVIDCAEAGAAMVHLHVRDEQGRQTGDLTAFSKTLDRIRASSNILIQGSTGGLSSLSLEARCVALNDPRVETASLNMGSVNFGDDVYVNRLPDIRYWARRMAEASVAPELEVFEAGMVPVIRQLRDEGVLSPPFSAGFCLGVKWALPADPASLFFLTSLLPEDSHWGVIHAGMQDFALLATAVGMGATWVRVGFEDSRYYAPGKAAATNAELVERVVSLIRRMGCDIAGPDDARRILMPQSKEKSKWPRKK